MAEALSPQTGELSSQGDPHLSGAPIPDVNLVPKIIDPISGQTPNDPLAKRIASLSDSQLDEIADQSSNTGLTQLRSKPHSRAISAGASLAAGVTAFTTAAIVENINPNSVNASVDRKVMTAGGGDTVEVLCTEDFLASNPGSVVVGGSGEQLLAGEVIKNDALAQSEPNTSSVDQPTERILINFRDPVYKNNLSIILPRCEETDSTQTNEAALTPDQQLDKDLEDWVSNKYDMPKVSTWFTYSGKFAPLELLSDVEDQDDLKSGDEVIQGVNLGTRVITDQDGKERLKSYIGLRPKIGKPYFIEVNYGELSNRKIIECFKVEGGDYPFSLFDYQSSTNKIKELFDKNRGRVFAYSLSAERPPNVVIGEFEERANELRPQFELAHDFLSYLGEVKDSGGDPTNVKVPEKVQQIINRDSKDQFTPELTLSVMGVYYYKTEGE